MAAGRTHIIVTDVTALWRARQEAAERALEFYGDRPHHLAFMEENLPLRECHYWYMEGDGAVPHAKVTCVLQEITPRGATVRRFQLLAPSGKVIRGMDGATARRLGFKVDPLSGA